MKTVLNGLSFGLKVGGAVAYVALGLIAIDKANNPACPAVRPEGWGTLTMNIPPGKLVSIVPDDMGGAVLKIVPDNRPQNPDSLR